MPLGCLLDCSLSWSEHCSDLDLLDFTRFWGCEMVLWDDVTSQLSSWVLESGVSLFGDVFRARQGSRRNRLWSLQVSRAQLSSACPAHMILVTGICRSTIFSSDTRLSLLLCLQFSFHSQRG
jgi:hypothetical protein